MIEREAVTETEISHRQSISDGEAPHPSDPRSALLHLVRLLARQAAREDYARALAGVGSRSYSTDHVGQDAIEES